MNKKGHCSKCKALIVRYFDEDDNRWYSFCVNKNCVKSKFYHFDFDGLAVGQQPIQDDRGSP